MSHKNEVTKQIVIGFLLMGALGAALWYILPDTQHENRSTYTLAWAALFAFPLFVGIHATLFERFNSENLIKGYAASSQPSFNKAYLSNTVEQTIVNILTAFSLGMVAPISYIKLVPIQASIFVVGRLLFYFSYKNNPMHRFIGFVMGYYVAILSAFLSIFWML